ncbi:MAG: type II toxin-antitoxin system VapC family toxin [Longimicrobiales bacterium]
MKLLLDTHFLLWTVLDLPRLEEFGWLDRYRPWGVSPVSFLEIQLLSEVGRLSVRQPEFMSAVGRDSRFVIDEVALVPLIRESLPLGWTRDPFDRLLVAHSAARATPLCTIDRHLRERHPHIVRELRS